MGLVEAIMEGSSLVQEWTEKAEAKGLQEGKADGEAGEARRLLRMALSRKYSGMETMPEIDIITSVSALESILLDRVLAGEDGSSESEVSR